MTVVGHEGGGQLGQQYAMLAKAPATGVHVRYVHGDPSSCAYFSKDRPKYDKEDLPSLQDCETYNNWRYDFDESPGTRDGIVDPREFFRRHVTRDIVSIVGYQDTSKSKGDQFCMACIQGGKKTNCNLIWYRYVNTLARKNESLEGFPGQFESLPALSDISDGRTNLRL